MNTVLKRCRCSVPQRGVYFGNGDAYLCSVCAGVVSGLELARRANKGKTKISK